MPITYSRRTAYPDIDVRPFLGGNHWERPPVVAFEADTPEEVRQVHDAVLAKLSAADCYGWDAGQTGAADRDLTLWADGKTLPVTPPRGSTTPTATWAIPATETTPAVNLSAGEIRSLPQISLRTYTWPVLGRLRAATWALRTWCQPWRQTCGLAGTHRRNFVYLDHFLLSVFGIRPTVPGVRPHRLSFPESHKVEKLGLNGTGIDARVQNLLVLLDMVPYELADRVLLDEIDAICELSRYVFSMKDDQKTMERLTSELIQAKLLHLAKETA